MSQSKKVVQRVSYPSQDVVDAGHSLIAVVSILLAVSDAYASTGQLPVGAIVHAANVVNEVIDKLKLVDVLVEKDDVPF